MGRIVQKYGGSSVADAESIKRVARRIARTRREGNEVIVVISAMGDTTGERQSAALLAMALWDIGVDAVSYTGSQAGVLTTPVHGNARIIDITPGRIVSALDQGKVAIVAGFQGVAQTTKDVTTLGRGASDTTAVALAASLGAEHCEIYSDVDGVYTADPRIVKSARHIRKIGYEDMMEMAAAGAKILHLRCVEYARRENVAVHVRSSFTDNPGTWIVPQEELEEAGMEEAIISGIAHDRDEAKITVVGVPDRVGHAAAIFKAISGADINIDMVVQNISDLSAERTDISFTLPATEGRKGVDAIERIKDEVGFDRIRYDDQIGKVSVVGVGMRSHPGVTATFFSALAEAGINLQMISTSEIRISVVVQADEVDRAVRAAHTAFELDATQDATVYAGTGR